MLFCVTTGHCGHCSFYHSFRFGKISFVPISQMVVFLRALDFWRPNSATITPSGRSSTTKISVKPLFPTTQLIQRKASISKLRFFLKEKRDLREAMCQGNHTEVCGHTVFRPFEVTKMESDDEMITVDCSSNSSDSGVNSGPG